MTQLGKQVDAVINIDVNPAILQARLTGRIICRECGATYHKLNNPPKVEGVCDKCGSTDFYQREDDKPETVENRIQINLKQAQPLLDYYSNKNVLFNVNGEDAIDVVFEK